MTDLLTLAREHDLPPRWDGFAVVWKPWQTPPPVFVCPPIRDNDVCTSCRLPRYHRGRPRWQTAVGLVCDRAWLDHDDYTRQQARRDRLPEHLRHEVRTRWWRRLHATRCVHCDHDVVTDTQTGQVWDLDHTDYGDEGSTAP